MKTYDLPAKLAASAMRDADRLIQQQHARGEFDDGDPNHPKLNGGINYATGKPATLFGYDTDAFMRKQHERAKS